MDRALDLLKKHWGHSSFRPLQREAIEAVVGGRDAAVLLPTGGGKSLTYQLPALLLDGVAVVVTPLIALMRDQVGALKARGIKAVAVHSGMTFHQIDTALDNCVYGDVKLLYIAPERLDTLVFRSRLKKMTVSLVAVDEAHCISQWGYDFRPSYLRIGALREALPGVPFLAVTATATPRVLDDILKYCKLDNPVVLKGSYERKNLSFVVRAASNKYEQLLRVAEKVDGSGIVYCRTRAQTEQVADLLRARGVAADFYHAGLDHRLRTLRQADWTNGTTRVVAATNAFGMGIDKADVRFVVHMAPPDSLEAYYQEAGRAGRDGRRAWAVLLYHPDDRAAVGKRLETEYPPLDEIRRVYESVFNFLQVSIGGGRDEIYDFDLMAFAAYAKVYSLRAYSAIKILELGGYMTLVDEMDHSTRIAFRISRDDLYRYRVETPAMDSFLKILLRSYTGLFADFVAVDEAYLAAASGFTERKVVEFLLALSRAKIIRYIPRRRTPVIVFHEERLPLKDVRIAPEIYTHRLEQSRARAEAVWGYVENTTECRAALLRDYFGDLNAAPCGVCDLCLENKADYAPAIRRALQERENRAPLGELVASVDGPAEQVVEAIKKMIRQRIVVQHEDGSVSFSK